jgi:SSS family solute:Na+ symporter
MLELIIILVYFVVMIGIGLLSSRKAKGIDDFFVAGRKGSSLFITGSLLATIVGGSATVGLAGLGFTRGLNGAWWLLVGSIGLIVLGFLFAKKVRQYALYTLPEMVKEQYDSRVALAGSILIIIAWTGIVAGQIIAAGKIMGVLGIGDDVLWMILFSIVFIVYTILGGQQAILRTDSLQSLIIFIGILGGLALVLSKVGGFGGLADGLSPEHFSFPVSSKFGWYDLLALLLLTGLTYVVGPDMYSRLFCAKDEKVARKSALWTALLLVPIAFAVALMGMGAAVLFPDIASEQALPTVIIDVLPPFVGGIVLAAVLCAIMSSADTCLLSASAIFTLDVIKPLKPGLDEKQVLNLSRWAMVVLGIGSLVLALVLKGVINALYFAYTVYTAGLVIPIIAGFYKKKLKVTPIGALVAIIGGGSVAVISKLLDIQYLNLGSLLISILLLFMVSYIDNRIKGRLKLDS